MLAFALPALQSCFAQWMMGSSSSACVHESLSPGIPSRDGESRAVWSPDSRLETWWHWDMSRFCHVIVTCDGDTGPRCHPTLGRCLHWCRPDTGEMPISGCSSKLVPLLSAGHLLSGATAVKWKIDLTVCCLEVVYCFASYIQTMSIYIIKYQTRIG